MTSTHLHITTWAVALILFVVVLALHRSGKEKAAKICQMVLRLFYILILGSGIQLFLLLEQPEMGYHLKMLFGLLLIAMLEMVLVRTTKGKSVNVFWGLLIVFLVATFYYGLTLPMGWMI